jgi:hypothetical protein
VRRTQLVTQLNDRAVEQVAFIPLFARRQPFSAADARLTGIRATPWDAEFWNIADWRR